jgi:hypothetical protein
VHYKPKSKSPSRVQVGKALAGMLCAFALMESSLGFCVVRGTLLQRSPQALNG